MTKVCPRCTVEHLEGDFRGGVCGWCADDLERIQTHVESRDEDEK